MRERINLRAMSLLSGGHLAVDFASGAVPALLPYLAEEFTLSYTETALIMLCATVSSSLVQPLFGLWSDRHGALWLISGGVGLAGVGLAVTSAAPVYWVVLVGALFSGLGVAAFHPEGAKLAVYASLGARATGMSYFNVGGNLGFAIGALVTGLVVGVLGLSGGMLGAAVIVVAALMLARSSPHLRALPRLTRAQRAAAGDDRLGAVTLLMTIVMFRTAAWFGLLTFVPAWIVAEGGSKSYGTNLLSATLFVGAVGTLVLGPVADRIGLRTTLVFTQLLLAPLILIFVFVGGPAGAVALALAGACVVGTFGITMVLSHLYLPRHVGMASGLTIGLAIGVGGISAVVLGALADAFDLRTALLVSALTPIGGVVLCLFLPHPNPGPAIPARVVRDDAVSYAAADS